MKFKVGSLLSLGFGVLIALMLVSSIIAFVKIGQVKRSAAKVIDEAMPASEACNTLENAINKSLASLRGYIILGADPDEAVRFRSERTAAWDEIDRELAELSTFRHVWTASEAQQSLDAIERSLRTLRDAQKEIEAVAHADDNIAAYKMLLDEAAPLADKMDNALAAIIDEEGALEATTRRKELLKVISDIRTSLAAGLASLRLFVISGREDYEQRFERQWKNYLVAYDKSARVLRRVTDEQAQQWDIFNSLHAQFEPLPAEMLRMRNSQDWNKANHLTREKAAPAAQLILAALDDLETSAADFVQQGRDDLNRSSAALATTLCAATVLAVFVGSLLAWTIRRRVVATVRKAIDSVAATATQMSATAEQQEQMAQQQAAAVNQVNTTMEELTKSAEMTSQQAIASLEGARLVLDLARNGTRVVDDTRRGMDHLSNRVDEIARQIAHLSDQSSQVGDITVLVSHLAKQTNILALNAAVEAAHAGEEGAGFAVVSAEIRKLAEESAKSAERIRNLVEEIQETTNSTVLITEQGSKTVHSGNELTNKTAEAFSEVASSVNGAVDAMQQISLNARQQASAVSHVGAAMEQINRGAHEAASQSVLTRQGIMELHQAVAELRAIV